MMRTTFVHVDVIILKHNLGLDLAMAGGANAVGQLVVEIGAISHVVP
jgi:hypothetical protein